MANSTGNWGGRSIDSFETMQAVMGERKTLLVDATERPYFRSQDPDWNQLNNSGKKNALPERTPHRRPGLISSTDRYVYYVGKTVGGTTHDYQAFKQEFDQQLGLLDTDQVLADLGYLGLPTAYESASIELPHRKPRRSKAQPDTALPDEQKQFNRQHARIRVKVEHSIGGSKRLGKVSQVFRNKSLCFNDLVIALAAGIWNFHLKAHCFI